MIARMSESDETALSSFFEATSPLVYGMAVRILRDHAAAEEVAAAVYLQAWRQAGRYDPARGAPSTWLLTIARTRSIDRLRQRAQDRQRVEPLAGQMLRDERPDPLEASVAAERRRRVQSALAELSAEQRVAIELAFFGGLSHTEIAARTAEPLGTVKTRIRLGMRKLAKVLRQAEEEE